MEAYRGSSIDRVWPSPNVRFNMWQANIASVACASSCPARSQHPIAAGIGGPPPKSSGELILLALGSCAARNHTHEHSHVHTHEPVPAARPSTRTPSSFWEEADHIFRGTAVDAAGSPTAANISLVDANGSYSTRVSNGVFKLRTNGNFPKTLCAWTPDGKIAWQVLETPPGGSPGDDSGDRGRRHAPPKPW